MTSPNQSRGRPPADRVRLASSGDLVTGLAPGALKRGHLLATVLLLMPVLAGCAEDGRLVVYCAVDETFGRQVFERFEEKTGLTVDAIFDTEAGKTAGLVKRIRSERSRPRADVFFSGELFQTILLAREGLLAEYDPPSAADISQRYKDPRHRWTAIGLRGRVLCFDGQRLGAEALPARWEDLGRAPFTAQTAFGNPLFGTTTGHVAAMFALWGEDRGRAFLTGLREGGATMVDGNSSAVREVMSGRAAMCMTDTDDVRAARKQHPTLDQRYLDLGDGGTLLIPSSVAVIANCPHPDLARRLANFLASTEVERMLALSTSGNIPVRESLRGELNMELPPTTQLSYERIADSLDTAAAAVREILIR